MHIQMSLVYPPPPFLHVLINVLFKRNEYHTTNNHRFERRWRTQNLGFATKGSGAFNINVPVLYYLLVAIFIKI